MSVPCNTECVGAGNVTLSFVCQTAGIGATASLVALDEREYYQGWYLQGFDVDAPHRYWRFSSF